MKRLIEVGDMYNDRNNVELPTDVTSWICLSVNGAEQVTELYLSPGEISLDRGYTSGIRDISWLEFV